MPPSGPWARYDPRIRLVLDDDQEVPCIRCSIDFELNAIPQATATIAVGRGFDGKPSLIHDASTQYPTRRPAQIYLTPNALGRPTNSALKPGALGLAGDEVRIFDGFVTAAGFTRSRGSAQYTIQMEHWLSDLGFSSIFSKTSHPMNPGDYAFNMLSPTGGAGGAFANLGLAYNFITSENVTTDFWGKALKPFLVQLAKQDAFYIPDPNITAGGQNDGALAALNRFNSPYQQPLALDVVGANADIISNIMNQVGQACSEPGPLAQQTMWDVIIGTFCAEYLFYVVPRVEDAVMVPFIPGYRKSFITITADQETQIEWMRGLGRPLRGVGILANAEFATGCTLPGQAAPAGMGIGGFYAPDPSREAKGMIIIKSGPSWMSRLYAPALYSAKSTGTDGEPIGTAIMPGSKKETDTPDAITARIKDTVRPFLDKYAQAHYALEKLRTRQAVCSGPFRLDIAPGSTVKVIQKSETHIEDDALGQSFFAHVGRVSLALDAEQPMAGTSFHLSHIRSLTENDQDRTSIERHPLYKTTFLGCPLVDLDV